MRTRHHLGFFLAVSAVVVCSHAHADAVAYSRVRDIRAENATVVLEHHHDWSAATRDARFRMISGTKDPFTEENTYSYLRLVDKASGKQLFKQPVPALTDLWLSSDSRYVVGLSSLMLWNPYQLVVFDRSGRRLLERDFTNVDWPGVMQSTTNSILWFKEPPVIRLEESGKEMVLSIEDRAGTLREFRFEASK